MKKLILLICLATLSFSSFASIKRIKENLVLVEGGEFSFSDKYRENFKDGNTKVKLTYNYYVGKYEVTFKDWKEVTGKTFMIKTLDTAFDKNRNEALDKSDKKPVTWITIERAMEFCNILSQKEGIPKAYDSKGNLLDSKGKITKNITKVKGYRLLTWAEWQYAALGGRYSKGYTYSGSNNLDEVAWYLHNTEALNYVGLKKSNELGLYDMTGNVQEMCYDYAYSSFSNINPVALRKSLKFTARIVAGGYYWAEPLQKDWDRIDAGEISVEDDFWKPLEDIYGVQIGDIFNDNTRKTTEIITDNGFTGFRIGKTAN